MKTEATSTTSPSKGNNNYEYELFKKIVNTQLHEAVVEKDINRVEECLANGADIECKNEDCSTALRVAIQNRYYTLSTLLVEVYGADVNAIDDCDSTVVIAACEIDYLEGLIMLITNGADVNLPDANGDTPLHVCVLRKSYETCNYLLVATANVNPNAKDYINEMTPLHYACMDSHYNMVKMLCSRMDINLNETDNDGNAAIHLACRLSNVRIAKFLIDKGCDINLKNLANQSPLDVACETHSLIIVQTLLAQQRLIRDFANSCTQSYLQRNVVEALRI